MLQHLQLGGQGKYFKVIAAERFHAYIPQGGGQGNPVESAALVPCKTQSVLKIGRYLHIFFRFIVPFMRPCVAQSLYALKNDQRVVLYVAEIKIPIFLSVRPPIPIITVVRFLAPYADGDQQQDQQRKQYLFHPYPSPIL